MRTSAFWVWMVGVTLANASTGGAADLAPAPRAVDDLWLPKPKPRAAPDDDEPVPGAPPSLFPNLVFRFPIWNGNDSPREHQQKVDAVAERTWPRLTSNDGLKIEPTDDTRRKFLKAQLRQGVLEYRGHFQKSIEIVGIEPPFTPPYECLTGLQSTAAELYAGQPKELVAWLEELLIAAKSDERYTRLRVGAGAMCPSRLNYATRHRLKLETDLWKAKNPVPQRIEEPARKDAKNAKPPEGDWLSEKKLPPTLFPDLVIPAPEGFDPKHGWQFLIDLRRAIQYAHVSPRLSGNTGLTIEPGDDTLRRLLKARLYQGAIEIHHYRTSEYGYGTDPMSLPLRCDCVYDLVNTVVELWEQQPKELIPWLEELLIDTKDCERITFLRVEAGALRQRYINQVTRVRLKVEAELWKAKNAK